MAKKNINTDLGHYAFGYGDMPDLYKIMFWNTKEKYHYTLLFNDHKKIMDVHKTHDDLERVPKYEPMMQIKYFTLLRFLALHSKMQVALLRKYWLSHTISIGKLIRLDAFILPMDSMEYASTFIQSKGTKKYRVRKEINLDELDRHFIEPMEIRQSQSETFIAHVRKNGRLQMAGIIIKKDTALHFINERNLKIVSEAVVNAAIEILKLPAFNSQKELLALLSVVA